MGEIISLLGFWGFSGGVRRRPQTTQTAFGGNRRKTGFRRGADERKNQNGQVHHHPGHARAASLVCAGVSFREALRQPSSPAPPLRANGRLRVRKRALLYPIQDPILPDEISLRNKSRGLISHIFGLNVRHLRTSKRNEISLRNNLRGLNPAFSDALRFCCVINLDVSYLTFSGEMRDI